MSSLATHTDTKLRVQKVVTLSMTQVLRHVLCRKKHLKLITSIL
jgi:hypothetical protein